MSPTDLPISADFKQDHVYRTIIDSYFPKPEKLPISDLREWYQAYLALDAACLDREHALIQAVQEDELDDTSTESCIVELSQKVLVENGFCKDCQNLFDNWPDLGDPEPICFMTEKNWPGSGADWKHAVARDCHTLILEAASRRGCKMCGLIVQLMKDYDTLDTFRKLEARLRWLDVQKTAPLSVQNSGTSSGQIIWVNYPGKVNQSCIARDAQDMRFYSAALEADVDVYEEQRDVLEIAKEWVESCAHNHEDCNVTVNETLPTRLISVAGPTPHLVLTEGWESKPQFCTLSHCWGTEPFLKLTVDNYESFLSRIPTGELPKTFQDAIHISRKLGVDYLWIDSLCIIQGNIEDWRREAGLMSNVYGGSYINIAASSATNAHEGCFLKEPYMVDGLRARININGYKYVRDFYNNYVYHHSVGASHLATRAWTLQEKLLPPRTIHFGDRGAFWECRLKKANEFLPDGFSGDFSIGLISQKHTYNFRMWWGFILSSYSAADLTFQSDKLPAIAGIARSIAKKRGGQYLAGMWREDLEMQLCWRVQDPQNKPQWRAPSWAWASVNGRTYSEDILDDVYTHVIEAQTVPSGDDEFGEVCGGFLRVKCSGLLAGRFVAGSRAMEIQLDDRDIVNEEIRVGEIPVSLDYLGEEEELDSTTVYLLRILGGYSSPVRRKAKFYLDNGESEDENDEQNNEQTDGGTDEKETKECRTNEENADSSSSSNTNTTIPGRALTGILLTKTGQRGEFRRVGFFSCGKHEAWQTKRELNIDKDFYGPFTRAHTRYGARDAREVCEEVVRGERVQEEEWFILKIV
ncbi:HET-domain-containing protein [Pyrenochaeta sp. DS3sAY3a]|nr:HET-domain-containing protein [Pyrenochaeta sp. DS3sAY3a]